MTKTALIVGTGSGISAAFARALHGDGYRVALSARSIDKLAALTKEIDALAIAADATQVDSVGKLFAEVDRAFGRIDVVLYNASYRTRGPFLDLDPKEVAKSIEVSAFGGFLVAQQAARRMVKQGEGAIFLTGASASVKGYAQSAPFAMGKFALRGMAQSTCSRAAAQGHPCGSLCHRRRRAQRRTGPSGKRRCVRRQLPRPGCHRRNLHGNTQAAP